MEHDWRDQSAYWDVVADAKQFSHPLPLEWLPASRFGEIALDVSRGYGGTVAELVAAGHDRAVGVDTSRRMVERGRAARPDLDLRAIEAGAREERRYAEGSERFGRRGVFQLPDGGVMRHHAEGGLEALVAPQAGFELVARRELDTLTMNGNPCRVVQLLARRIE